MTTPTQTKKPSMRITVKDCFVPFPGNPDSLMTRNIPKGWTMVGFKEIVAAWLGLGRSNFELYVQEQGTCRDLRPDDYESNDLYLVVKGPDHCPSCNHMTYIDHGRDYTWLVDDNSHLDDYEGTVVYRLKQRAQCGYCWKKWFPKGSLGAAEDEICSWSMPW